MAAGRVVCEEATPLTNAVPPSSLAARGRAYDVRWRPIVGRGVETADFRLEKRLALANN